MPHDDAPWQRLQATFPDGVCDWSEPGVGEVDRSRTWLDFGDEVGAEPTPISHRVARSTAAPGRPVEPPPPGAGPAVAAPDDDVDPARAPLPTTGGGAALAGLLVLAVARGARRRR